VVSEGSWVAGMTMADVLRTPIAVYWHVVSSTACLGISIRRMPWEGFAGRMPAGPVRRSGQTKLAGQVLPDPVWRGGV